MGDHVTYVDLISFFLLTTATLFVSTEAGYRFGRHREYHSGTQAAHDAAPTVLTIEAALLGLLALMLGFAFAMAMQRYDDRKQVILEEANDIRTAYLGSALLPEPYSEESRRLLLAYLDSRIAGSRPDASVKERQIAHGATHRLQRDLWALAVAAVHSDKSEVTTGNFIASLSEVVADFNRRLTAIANHVPEVILALLFIVAVLALGVTGAGAGLVGVRLWALRLTLAFLVSAILTVIIDLDRPGEGLIQVSTNKLTDLRGELPSIDPHLAGLEAERR